MREGQSPTPPTPALSTPAGDRYEPTAEDVLWLLRAVAHEGRPHERVARTLISGFMWAREHRTGWVARSLTDWVRAYAQPVNPRWLPGGDLYEARMQRARERRDHALMARFENQARRRRAAVEQTEFPAHVVRAVAAALDSGRASPATDYAAWWATADRGRIPLGEPKKGENRFYTRLASWRGYIGGGPELVASLLPRGAVPSGGGGAVTIALLFVTAMLARGMGHV